VPDRLPPWCSHIRGLSRLSVIPVGYSGDEDQDLDDEPRDDPDHGDHGDHHVARAGFQLRAGGGSYLIGLRRAAAAQAGVDDYEDGLAE
jgi:hypothetical protein